MAASEGQHSVTQQPEEQGTTYAAAGVDIDAADRFKSRLQGIIAATRRPEVLADVGLFASLFRLGQYREPVLVASVDGVGTKVKLATLLNRYDSVGQDIVNHCVNDALTTGAHPLFFLDYISGNNLPAEAKADLVMGMAEACRAVGCALVGGETADMPDVYASGDFDLAGFIVGVVEKEQIIDGSNIAEDDVLLGLPSSGLHTNGYSLVRRLFNVGVGGDPEKERATLDRYYPGLGPTLGETLLTPHRCYYREVAPVLPYLKGIAHITGGGLPGNVPRILPQGLAARFQKGSWRIQPIFHLIQKQGNVSEAEMYRTFNMGLGMVLVCSPQNVHNVQCTLPEARVVGQVVKQTGQQRVIIE